MVKVMTSIQRILAALVLVYGVILLFSEVPDAPDAEGLLAQLKVTAGGAVLIALAIGWLVLVNWEENYLKRRTHDDK